MLIVRTRYKYTDKVKIVFKDVYNYDDGVNNFETSNYPRISNLSTSITERLISTTAVMIVVFLLTISPSISTTRGLDVNRAPKDYVSLKNSL